MPDLARIPSTGWATFRGAIYAHFFIEGKLSSACEGYWYNAAWILSAEPFKGRRTCKKCKAIAERWARLQEVLNAG
jgi:hypothetical protein